MSLGPGTRLGPYEILSAVGAGGMGEVYRARDTRLKRDVALKILPESFASDPDRLARFQREAEVLASLNHPNIAAIHGLEESDGVRALVMELVDGETLADRIARGPIPVDEALPIAKQIAEALEAAHEQGIIHRDLKPANIKVRPDGTVKVLDFGLAKLAEPVASGQSAVGREHQSMSPTITSPALMTGLGVLLGTAAYMSPEQARGRTADKRSDIWAFGCALYEMLTGRRAFPGDDIAQTLARVLERKPEWSELPTGMSPAIHRMVRRCLQKDPRQRLRDIGDARLEIEECVGRSADTRIVRSSERPRNRRVAWMLAAVYFVASLVAVTVAVMHFRERPPESPSVRSSVLPPEGASTFVLDANLGGTAISPDGRQLAFVAEVDGKRMLYVRDLDSLSARALPGTEDAARPFWSPDGRNIGFFARGQLQRIGLSEGAPRAICPVPIPRGATWSQDDVIVFSSARPGVLSRVAASGGTPVPVTVVDEAAKETFHYWPQFLPDGRHFLYFARNLDGAKSAVYVASLDDKPGDRKRIHLVYSSYGAVFAANPRDSRTGHLFFVQGASLMVQPFDTTALKLTGEAEAFAQNVGGVESSSYVDFSASGTGVLAYGNGRQGTQRLVWFDRKGNSSDSILELGARFTADPVISPDGTSALVNRDGDVWRIDLAQATATRFTFSQNTNPVWSPDGREIIYRGLEGILRKPASGTKEPSLLLAATWAPGGGSVQDWSDDGRFVLYSPRPADQTRAELWAVPFDSNGAAGKPFLYLKLPGRLRSGARFSRGATPQRWVAYDILDGSGASQVFVQDFPAAHGKWQISTDNGDSPRWSRDGKELFFLSDLGRRLMSAVVTSSAQEFGIASPALVFQSPRITERYDVGKDGQRFLFVVERGDEQNPRLDTITLVQNWRSASSDR